jgi:MtN3 and saliva related transmembrane protein
LSPMDAFGYVGGGLVALSFFPQLFRVIKLKTANEISIVFAFTMFAGCLIWTAYAFYMQQLPMMICSIVNTSQTGLLMSLKYIYSRHPARIIIGSQLTKEADTVVSLGDSQQLVEEDKKQVEMNLN